jgi:hypothetical protein
MTYRAPWPEAQRDRLIALWAAGWSVDAIARDLGVGKDAVMGKAKRLTLTRRQHVIEPEEARPVAGGYPGTSLPALPSGWEPER